MVKIIKNQNGFSLIEIIAVLVLVSILAAGAGMGVIAITRGYLHAEENAQMAQKTNIAMKRISREFQEIISVTSASVDSITFVSKFGTRTIGFDNNAIKLSADAIPIANGDIIIDNILNLNFNFTNSLGDPWVDTDSIFGLTGITISFNVIRTDISSGSMAFTTTVYLRSNQNSGGSI